MSIWIQHGPCAALRSDDPERLVPHTFTLARAACFAGTWESVWFDEVDDADEWHVYRIGQVYTQYPLLSPWSPPGTDGAVHEITAGQVQTLIRAMYWLRGLGYRAAMFCARATHTLNTGLLLNAVGTEVYIHRDDLSDYVFTGLSLVRMFSTEFVDLAAEAEDVDEVISRIFSLHSNAALVSAHMPFTSWRCSEESRAIDKCLSALNADKVDIGRALMQWWTETLPTRKWKGSQLREANNENRANMRSKISITEFLAEKFPEHYT